MTVNPKPSFSKRLSLILLVFGIILLGLTGVDIVVYGFEGRWKLAIVLVASWGLIGLGLTLVGLGLLIQSKIEQA